MPPHHQFKHEKGDKGVETFHHREIQKTPSPSSPEMYNVTNAFLHSSPFIEKQQGRKDYHDKKAHAGLKSPFLWMQGPDSTEKHLAQKMAFFIL